MLSSTDNTSKRSCVSSSSSSSILSLPHELITTEILARVASCSSTDLFNAKLSSKDLLEAANDDHIFKHISIDKFERYITPYDNQSKQVSSFLQRCKECGNSEVLFRAGMSDFFGSKQESGLKNLKKAVENGHVDAIYVYGIILLCSGDENKREEGLKLLSSFKKSQPKGFKLSECRERVENITRLMADIIWRPWVHRLVREQELCSHSKRYRYEDPWLPGLTRELEGCCEKCELDNEADLFCTMMAKCYA
ncbi:hypothetical protein SLEP1_g43468 [Rubroshorea leprosula]|uniref:At2g35280-like TPR domain-containing protein n=1 Tax=Rubroshorea leprosula TaxID=152421 RepID=A0AAV5LD29_9ROSI|nr:hypothetical protein SLEP1_g43468 [Rubroshorea leprosula]